MRAVRFTLCLFVVLVAHAAAVSAPGESAAEESGATGSDPLGGKKPSELIKDHYTSFTEFNKTCSGIIILQSKLVQKLVTIYCYCKQIL